nr:MAG TPA: YopX protein [Caudoviricetes sp.]
MREILFRGKELKSDGWIYGYLLSYGWAGKEKWFILPSGVSMFCTEEIDLHTVGQWTGVLDSDGAKIFEGDILEIEKGTRKYRRQVKWFGHVQLPRFELVDADGIVPRGDIPGLLVWDEYGAYRYVIGNIYDNPELLEGCEA